MTTFSADLLAAWGVVQQRPDLQGYVQAGDFFGLANAAPSTFTVRNTTTGRGSIVLDVGVMQGLLTFLNAGTVSQVQADAYAPFVAAASGNTDVGIIGRGVGDIYQAGYVGAAEPVASVTSSSAAAPSGRLLLWGVAALAAFLVFRRS